MLARPFVQAAGYAAAEIIVSVVVTAATIRQQNRERAKAVRQNKLDQMYYAQSSLLESKQRANLESVALPSLTRTDSSANSSQSSGFSFMPIAVVGAVAAVAAIALRK